MTAKHFRTLVLSLGTFGTLLCPIHAQVAAVRKAIQNNYDKRNAALAKKNAVGAFANQASDFLAIDENGREKVIDDSNRQDQLEHMQIVLKNIKFIHETTQIQSVALDKNGGAIVTVKDTYLKSRVDPTTQQEHQSKWISTYRDYWKKSQGKWMMQRHKTVSQQRVAP